VVWSTTHPPYLVYTYRGGGSARSPRSSVRSLWRREFLRFCAEEERNFVEDRDWYHYGPPLRRHNRGGRGDLEYKHFRVRICLYFFHLDFTLAASAQALAVFIRLASNLLVPRGTSTSTLLPGLTHTSSISFSIRSPPSCALAPHPSTRPNKGP